MNRTPTGRLTPSIPRSRAGNWFAPVSEKQFAGQLEDLFRLFGWTWYHTWLSARSAAGFLDYVAVRPPRVLFIEIKGDGGVVSKDQERWLAMLKACWGVEVYCWWPGALETAAEVLR